MVALSSTSTLDRLLRPALERAVTFARSSPTVRHELMEVPPGIRPLLHFTKLPPRALSAVRVALDNEPEFLRRVGEASSEAALGPAGWLFVTRPEHWREQLEVLVAAAESSREHDEAETARRDAAHLRSIVTDLETRIERADAEIDRLGRQVREQQASLDDATARAGRLGDELEKSRGERGDAVRRLKDVEARLALRTAELRALRTAGPEPSVESDSDDDAPDPGLDVAAMVGLSGRLAERIAQVSELVEQLRDELAPATFTDDLTEDIAARPGSPGGQFGRRTPRRRRPVTLRRGVLDDSSEAAEQLFSLPGAVVLVDGYNLAILAWSELTTSERRRCLEQVAVSWHARYGADFILVFDGDSAGGRAVRTAGSPVRVMFTPEAVEADDEILARISEIPLETPCIVVSDDRRVRAGASERGANVVGSRQVLSLL